MIRFGCLLALVWATVLAAQLRAEDLGVLDAEKMKVALHTAAPQENGFIDYVVAQVQKNKLPADLVESTFLWALKKPEKRRFYYFKCALVLRAAERGIKL